MLFTCFIWIQNIFYSVYTCMDPIQHATFCETCGGVLEADSESWNKESKEICLTLLIALLYI